VAGLTSELLNNNRFTEVKSLNEIDGNVDTALQWAQKAYEDYNIKLAREYSRILENRKMKLNVIEEQQK
jgi:GH35 family endo-1,4-beta-xylanase